MFLFYQSLSSTIYYISRITRIIGAFVCMNVCTCLSAFLFIFPLEQRKLWTDTYALTWEVTFETSHKNKQGEIKDINQNEHTCCCTFILIWWKFAYILMLFYVIFPIKGLKVWNDWIKFGHYSSILENTFLYSVMKKTHRLIDIKSTRLMKILMSSIRGLR